MKKESTKTQALRQDRIRVVELFAGVGGFRLGLEGWKGYSASSGYQQPLRSGEMGYAVVWSNQWEPSTKRQHANEVYKEKWPEAFHSEDDIASVVTDDIPDHDMLVGGFPCQDYSVASTLKNSKGLRGKKGVLWWQIERILREKGVNAPKYLLLENVDRLLKSPSHQRGRDFAVMLASLSDLGYAVEWRVLNAADYGMPQRRRRVFLFGYKFEASDKLLGTLDSVGEEQIFSGIISRAFPVQNPSTSRVEMGAIEGSLEEVSKEFNSKKAAGTTPFLSAGFMKNRQFWTADVRPQTEVKQTTLQDILQPIQEVDNSFFVKDSEIDKWQYLKGAKREPRENKSLGYTYVFSEGALAFPDPVDKPSRTIITGEGGSSPSRTKHVISQGMQLRRLTPIELERLNMFPDNHTSKKGISDGKRAFFMGNALVVGIVEGIGTALLNQIEESKDSIKVEAHESVI
jgi:DNA (cytosine-5)-methyltransferase 1